VDFALVLLKEENKKVHLVVRAQGLMKSPKKP